MKPGYSKEEEPSDYNVKGALPFSNWPAPTEFDDVSDWLAEVKVWLRNMLQTAEHAEEQLREHGVKPIAVPPPDIGQYLNIWVSHAGEPPSSRVRKSSTQSEEVHEVLRKPVYFLLHDAQKYHPDSLKDALKDLIRFTIDEGNTLSRRRWHDGIAARLEQEHGVAFRRVPDEVYAGMPYATAETLSSGGTIGYSEQQLLDLATQGKVASYQIEEEVLFPPDAVERMLREYVIGVDNTKENDYNDTVSVAGESGGIIDLPPPSSVTERTPIPHPDQDRPARPEPAQQTAGELEMGGLRLRPNPDTGSALKRYAVLATVEPANESAEVGRAAPTPVDPEAERWRQLEETAQRLDPEGVIFQRMPAGLEPGTPYTTLEAMAKSGLLRYTPGHAYNLVRKQEIPAHRIGRQVLLTPDAAEQIINHQEGRAPRKGPGGRPIGSPIGIERQHTHQPDHAGMTPRELADSGLTRYSESHIRKLASQGIIPAHRVLHRLVLDEEGVRLLLERERHALTEPSPGKPPGHGKPLQRTPQN